LLAGGHGPLGSTCTLEGLVKAVNTSAFKLALRCSIRLMNDSITSTGDTCRARMAAASSVADQYPNSSAVDTGTSSGLRYSTLTPLAPAPATSPRPARVEARKSDV
jgi:hypothetical protein